MTRFLLVLLCLTGLLPAGPHHPNIEYIFPEPDNEFITIHTTIILTLEKTLNDQISNLENLISVRNQNDVLSGKAFFSSDDRTIIFKPDAPLPTNSKMDVTIQTSQFGGDDFSYSFYTPADSRNEMDWLPKQSTSSKDEIVALAPPRLINGVAVPSDFPEIYVNEIGETAPGRLFIPAGKWIIICENDGTPYFYRKYNDGRDKMRFEAHPSGMLSFHSFEVYDVILDQNFVEIDTVYPGHGYEPDDHELQILDNGHMLLVARDRVRVNMSKIVPGANNNAIVEAHHVQELDRDHNVVFEWNNWNHLDIREAKVSLQGGFVDFVHTNSIAVDYDGHLIVSPREFNRFMKINRLTGETIWQLGGETNDFTFVNEDLEFSRIHDVRPVPGKPNHYTLFDNGRDRSRAGQFSRGVEYKLDLDAKTAEKIWQYRHSPDLFTSYCGSTQPLENGNRLIGWAGHDYFTEVDSSGELVYEMHISRFSCSRVRRCDWDGMMRHPHLIVENMGGVIRLIFNKFGDDYVDHYKVYSGTSSNSLTLLDSTIQTYLDIDAGSLNSGVQYFFKVSAVNVDGTESDLSELESTTVQVVAPGENAVQNGDFQSMSGWRLRRSDDARATGLLNNDGYFEINITDGGSNLDDVQLLQENLLVMQGKNYVFQFDAYASRARAIGARIESTGSSPINYGRIGNTALSTRPQHFKFEFPMNEPTDFEARVVFDCGASVGNVYFDNVSLTYSEEADDLAPLVSPWKSMDIGSPSITGVAGMKGDLLLVRGSGNDIWNQNDAFHFVYQQIEGDAEIIAHVYTLQETDPWAKAGVMMRNSLDASSKHAMMILSAENGAAFQRRVEDGGASTHTAGTNAGTPHWVRLVRQGNSFRGFESSNGTDWTLVGSENITMNDKIFVGLPVTSHNDDLLCEALFATVNLNGTVLHAANETDIPVSFELYPAYPNPFNPKTTIQYDVPQDSDITIAIYDVQGRHVKTLVDERQESGSHNMAWNGTNAAGDHVASGLYLCRLTAGDVSRTIKMTLLK